MRRTYVSQIVILTRRLSTLMALTLKSTPIVGCIDSNTSSVNRKRILDFPTPLSPTSKILKVSSNSISKERFSVCCALVETVIPCALRSSQFDQNRRICRKRNDQDVRWCRREVAVNRIVGWISSAWHNPERCKTKFNRTGVHLVRRKLGRDMDGEALKVYC